MRCSMYYSFFPLSHLIPSLLAYVIHSQKNRFRLFYSYFSHSELDPFIHSLFLLIPSIFPIHTLSKIRQNLSMDPSHEDVLILLDFHVTIVQAYHFAMSREPTPTKGKTKRRWSNNTINIITPSLHHK